MQRETGKQDDVFDGSADEQAAPLATRFFGRNGMLRMGNGFCKKDVSVAQKEYEQRVYSEKEPEFVQRKAADADERADNEAHPVGGGMVTADVDADG